ncbi:hypothetical protein [Nonomuraea aridisoli]|uniref:hypothetical protein n=1 Tax=Nonomuraea aridisoli TaxID=2070368 RepID=UPI0015E8844C|nr:hypothetical protein [Nonomuraea aridisoli]
MPSATRYQMSQVVSQLIDHYLALPERAALEATVLIAAERQKVAEQHALLSQPDEPRP